MRKTEASAWKVPWKGIIVAFIFSALALIVVLSKVAKPSEIIRELEAYPLSYFFGAVFFVLVAWIVDGQRIGMLTRAVQHKIPWWQLAITLGAANFLTLVTPFAGGGGALLVYYLYRRGIGVPTATAIVTAGGIAGQLSLSTLAMVMFTVTKDIPSSLGRYLNYVKFGAAGYFVILLSLLVLILKSERFFQWVFNKRGAESKSAAWIEEFRTTYQLILGPGLRNYVACVVIAFCYYSVYYLGGFMLLSGFGVFNTWLRYGISVLFGIAPVFSPIPGGAGTSELIAYLVLEDVLPLDALGTFIVLWRTVVFYIPILLGGSIFTFMAFRWAALRSPSSLGDGDGSGVENSSSTVILPEENDHNR